MTSRSFAKTTLTDQINQLNIEENCAPIPYTIKVEVDDINMDVESQEGMDVDSFEEEEQKMESDSEKNGSSSDDNYTPLNTPLNKKSKGRGRPRKIENGVGRGRGVSSTSTSRVRSQEDGVRRGRGRPSKKSIEGRGRGRPRKIKPEPTLSGTSSSVNSNGNTNDNNKVQRPRGRPKKIGNISGGGVVGGRKRESRLKEKSARLARRPSSLSPDIVSPRESQPGPSSAISTSRGRGRPPKESSSGRRGRGRPKKYVVVKSNSDNPSSDDEEDDHGDGDEEDNLKSSEPSSKSSSQAQTEKEEDNTQIAVPQKRRGRPPKNPTLVEDVVKPKRTYKRKQVMSPEKDDDDDEDEDVSIPLAKKVKTQLNIDTLEGKKKLSIQMETVDEVQCEEINGDVHKNKVSEPIIPVKLPIKKRGRPKKYKQDDDSAVVVVDLDGHNNGHTNVNNQQEPGFILEICVDTIQSIINAVDGGATRIELCSALSEGGLTPSVGFLQKAKKVIQMKQKNVPINVMIRPRCGDFIYSDDELEIMEMDIKSLKQAGADGFVFGAMTRRGEIDVSACIKLLEVCAPHPATFHRAFDNLDDEDSAFASLELLIDLGFSRILTSGLQQSAKEGIPLLKQLVDKAQNRIKILAGAGVNPENVEELVNLTGVHEVHGSARVKVESKMMQKQRDGGNTISMGKSGDDSYHYHFETSLNLVEQIVSTLNSIRDQKYLQFTRKKLEASLHQEKEKLTQNGNHVVDESNNSAITTVNVLEPEVYPPLPESNDEEVDEFEESRVDHNQSQSANTDSSSLCTKEVSVLSDQDIDMQSSLIAADTPPTTTTATSDSSNDGISVVYENVHQVSTTDIKNNISFVARGEDSSEVTINYVNPSTQNEETQNQNQADMYQQIPSYVTEQQRRVELGVGFEAVEELLNFSS